MSGALAGRARRTGKENNHDMATKIAEYKRGYMPVPQRRSMCGQKAPGGNTGNSERPVDRLEIGKVDSQGFQTSASGP